MLISFLFGFSINLFGRINYNQLKTDSGFDSSFDSGGGGGGSDSSWSSSDSSSGGSSVASEEAAIFKQYFPNGFNLKDYFKYLGSPEYFGILIEDLFFHAFLSLMVYLFIFNGKEKKIKNIFKIYQIITAIIYIIFPSVMFFILEFFVWIVIIFKSNPQKSRSKERIVQEVNLEKYNINKEELQKEVYDIYIRVQEAWSNFELEKVKDVISDEIYNMYDSQLSTMKIKNEQNVMSDFKFLKCTVIRVQDDENTLTRIIDVELEVLCKDYIINTKNNKVVRGNKNYINTYVYKLSFKKSKENSIDTCPSCSAKITESGNTVRCPYCGTTINRESNNLVLISKSMIVQY